MVLGGGIGLGTRAADGAAATVVVGLGGAGTTEEEVAATVVVVLGDDGTEDVDVTGGAVGGAEALGD
jgi:hypothetical protein